MADTIHIYGDIGSYYWSDGIEAKDIVSALKELDSTAVKHTVRINSPGGLVDEGLTMQNVLSAHKRQMKAFNDNFQLETICDGYCMSAATLPFMAGDIRTIALGGVFMIHNAWSWASGDAASLRDTADVLDKLSGNIADIYSKRCSPAAKGDSARDSAYFQALMNDESYFVGDEAVKVGLATNVDEDNEAVVAATFTPEILKGHYVEYMTNKRVMVALKCPTSAKRVLDFKAAQRNLEAVSASIGFSLAKK